MVTPAGRSNSIVQPLTVAVEPLRTTYLSRNQEPLSAEVNVAVTPAEAAAGVTAATNTIANPGFESGLAGWSCTSVSSAVTGHAHAGTMALQGAANNSDNAQCTQNVTVTPNTRYTLSAWVNGNYVFIGATNTGGS